MKDGRGRRARHHAARRTRHRPDRRRGRRRQVGDPWRFARESSSLAGAAPAPSRSLRRGRRPAGEAPPRLRRQPPDQQHALHRQRHPAPRPSTTPACYIARKLAEGKTRRERAAPNYTARSTRAIRPPVSIERGGRRVEVDASFRVTRSVKVTRCLLSGPRRRSGPGGAPVAKLGRTTLPIRGPVQIAVVRGLATGGLCFRGV